MGRLAERLRDEFLPIGRPDDRVGIQNVPGGEAGYVAAVARHTTTTLTPEEIHAIGLQVLDEMAALEHHRTQRPGRDRLRADHRADAVGSCAPVRDQRPDRRGRPVGARPGRRGRGHYFPDYDITDCVIEVINPIEASNTALAYYRPPAIDGSRPGAHCLLATEPEKRFRFEYESLAFHESVPGHHLQLATAQTLDIPRYRRYLDVEACSFNEGWGLYSEEFADEIGLYSDDLSRLGMLSFRALRACRLVVDTGIHHYGWSRERAIRFMWENTATTIEHVTSEVDRYIAWPGQALAYMIGRREILRLRQDARMALGGAFSIKGFHGVVLGSGAVPLTVLAENVERWTPPRKKENGRWILINGARLNVEVLEAASGDVRPCSSRTTAAAASAHWASRKRRSAPSRPLPRDRLRRARLRPERGRRPLLARAVGRRRRRPAPVGRRRQGRRGRRLVRRVHRARVRRGVPRSRLGDPAPRHVG